MSTEMILNELSIIGLSDRHTARQRMELLVDTLIAATSSGFSRVLRTHEDVNGLLLSEGYTLAQWRNDPEVERERKQFLRLLITKAPFLSEVVDLDLQERANLAEFKFEQQQCEGLGYAYWLEGLAVSLLSGVQWDRHAVDLSMTELNPDGTWYEETISVRHASRRIHIAEHLQWLRSKQQSGVQNGTDLWHKRTALFQSLVFCEDVGANLSSIEVIGDRLGQIVRKLQELDGYGSTWIEGAFRPDLLVSKASPESEATLQQYHHERTFLCPDGRERCFSWHLRLTPQAWRIYFWPLPSTRQIVIGYIGPHLRTVTYPT